MLKSSSSGVLALPSSAASLCAVLFLIIALPHNKLKGLNVGTSDMQISPNLYLAAQL